MKKINKKAQEKTIVSAILFLILIIVTIFIVSKLAAVADESSEKDRCKDSVIMHSRFRIDGKPLSDSIMCPTKYVKITESENAAIMRAIANEMYDCWDNFGQGKLELFDSTNDKFCVVCSIISFEKKKELPGFGAFISTEKIPTRNETYLDFFAAEDTDSTGIKETATYADNEFTLNTADNYAVMFVYDKQAKISTITKMATGAVIGATGALIGMALVMGGATAPVGLAVLAKTATIVAAASGAGGALIAKDAGADESEWQASVFLIKESAIGEIGCTSIPKNK